ncbi:MAG: hypothetical protein KKA31_05495 [Candidatus Margulisbacteria bacterium]|nr:hypothetical protein [Candidatus Margulisiibacteriota bacterium]
MSIIGNNSLGAELSNIEKFYANPKQQHQQDDAAREVTMAPAEQRLSGVFMRKDDKGNVKVEMESDRIALSSTTVALDSSPKPILVAALSHAKERLDQFKKKLFTKLLETYEEAFKNTFNHNRLVANVAKWTIGNVLEKLVSLGMNQRELGEIRSNIRYAMIEETNQKMSQISYDEALFEVVG